MIFEIEKIVRVKFVLKKDYSNLVLKIDVTIQETISFITHARTKRVKNLKFTFNVYFSTAFHVL